MYIVGPVWPYSSNHGINRCGALHLFTFQSRSEIITLRLWAVGQQCVVITTDAEMMTQHLMQFRFFSKFRVGYFGIWTFVTSMQTRHFPADISGSSDKDKTQLKGP